MDALTALVAALLSGARALTVTDLCPGGWAWATTAFGVAVGLLPTAGALVVAVLRRRIGSRYRAGAAVALAATGLVTAGLLPLLAYTATGAVFTAAAAGQDVPGLTGAGDLDDTVCVAGPQVEYLAAGSVVGAFDPADPIRFGLAVVVLGLLPLLAALFVAGQARLVLRRGPAWPSRFFWLPVLALAFLTADAPAGASGHLWLGVTTGAFLGMLVLLPVRPPSREVVRRSLEAPPPGALPRPPRPVTAARGPAGGSGLGHRLARRFAARESEPVVALDAADPPAPVRTPTRVAPPPTLVAPARPDTGAPATGATAGAVARFRLIRRLGAGGFGRVWLAHDARLGHPVALKAAHAPDEETEERIRREARALGAVRHPHCIRIHDLVHASADPGLRELSGLVIVMEYRDGVTLGELVRTHGPLDDIAAARIWSSIAGALDAAHREDVLHRDVKPGNVVVDPRGFAHLIDFGIARRTGDATLTMAGFVLGTPDFLAPEVAAGERASPASDAWQLAATVSFALTGQPPRGEHPDAVSGLRAAAAGAALTQLPQRSAHLALLRASMETEPARRPPLGAAHRALDQWLSRAGARPDGPVSTAGLPIR